MFPSICPPFLWRQTCILPAITLWNKSWFSFSKCTSFIIHSLFSCMHLIRMSLQIAFIDSVKYTLTNVHTTLSGWFSWILDKLFLKKINIFLSTFCSPTTRAIFVWFKLDLSVLYISTFFRMIIFVGETLFQNRCSKSC